MKKFRFRLEPVRKERKRVEDLRLKEWTIVSRMMRDLQDQLRLLQQEEMRIIEQSDDTKQASTLHLGMIIEHQRYLDSLKIRQEWKRNEIKRAEKFVDRKKQEWMLAKQKREILDKLEEKQKDRYNDELASREQKVQDDIYIMRARMGSILNEEEVDFRQKSTELRNTGKGE